jgi:WD40 repeat protein
MRRSRLPAFAMLATRDGEPLRARAGHSVRLPILNLTRAILLAVVAGILVVFACEPEETVQESPVWSGATGHPQGIWAVAFASDGRRLATGGFDGDVVIWEVGKGALRVLSNDRPSSVQCLAFAPDGATLAAGYDGAGVVLWDVATGEKRATFPGQTSQIRCLAFSPDGRTLASGAAELNIRIWDVKTGTTKTTLLGHHGSICALRFAPDGQTLASGSRNGMVKLWDLTAGKGRELTEADLKIDPILGLAFSPDGLMLASGSAFHGTRLWNAATGRESATFKTEAGYVPEVAFSSDGQMLIEARQSLVVLLRDVATGSRRTRVRADIGSYCAAFTPDARFLASGGDDAIVRVWDLAPVDGGKSHTRIRDR